MLSQDKLHELITAALQRLTIPGAEVTHDEKVGNRQFDVLVRVRLGMHTVLMAYEVKDRKRPTSVETIDAFTTKARDVGADKAVVVSTSGFQKGAIDAAKKHSIDLFKLTLVADALPTLKQQGTYLLQGTRANLKDFKPEMRVVKQKQRTNAVRDVRIAYEDGSEIRIPDEASQMQHCLGTSRIGGFSLIEHIERNLKELAPVGKEVARRIVLNGQMDTYDEMFVKRGRVKGLDLVVEGVEGDVIDGNYRMDLTSVDRTVIYENVFSKEKFETALSVLPLGFDDFQEGKFYFTINPLRYHFCEHLDGEIATLVLVESFQMSELVQWEFTQNVRYARFYLPMEDKDILTRLNRRLQRFRSLRVMTV